MTAEADLQQRLNQLEEQLSALYKERREVLEALAEERGEYELPPPRFRTPTQQAVAFCPRCGDRLKEKAAP